MRLTVLLSILLAPTLAAAQTPAAPTPAAQSAATTRGPTPFQQSMLQGVTNYQRQAWDPAMAAFREAARLDGASALPQLYLGYTALSRGDAASAQGFLREALRLATVAADDLNQARARIALAAMLEGGTQWDPARSEWEQYVRFADGHAATVPAAIGRARLDALARRQTVAQESEPVRQRIEARLRANASGANQTPPPGMVPVSPGGAAR